MISFFVHFKSSKEKQWKSGHNVLQLCFITLYLLIGFIQTCSTCSHAIYKNYCHLNILKSCNIILVFDIKIWKKVGYACCGSYYYDCTLKQSQLFAQGTNIIFIHHIFNWRIFIVNVNLTFPFIQIPNVRSQ